MNNIIRTMAVYVCDNLVLSPYDGCSTQADILECTIKNGHLPWFPLDGDREAPERGYVLFNIPFSLCKHDCKNYKLKRAFFVDGAWCELLEPNERGWHNSTQQWVLANTVSGADQGEFYMQMSKIAGTLLPFFDGSEKGKNIFRKMTEYVNRVVERRIDSPIELERLLERTIRGAAGFAWWVNMGRIYGSTNFQWQPGDSF